jgi:hypothetical protein
MCIFNAEYFFQTVQCSTCAPQGNNKLFRWLKKKENYAGQYWPEITIEKKKLELVETWKSTKMAFFKVTFA